MTATWPEGVIARYLTVGGATVDLAHRPGYSRFPDLTETVGRCNGCSAECVKDWGFDFWAAEHNQPQLDTFDSTGESALPAIRDWAQAHAEKCRAMPKQEA